MHEQSDTISQRGRSYNVYGRTNYPLPLVFPWEQRSYEDDGTAANRAAWRSRMTEEEHPDYEMQAPAYGFGPVARRLLRQRGTR